MKAYAFFGPDGKLLDPNNEQQTIDVDTSSGVDAKIATEVAARNAAIAAAISATRWGFTMPLNFLGNAAAVERYANFSAITTPIGYSMPAGRLKRLVLHSWLNTLAAPRDTVYEIYKNQVATGLTVTLLSTDAPFVVKGANFDLAWAADDMLDVKGILAAGSTSGSLSTQVTAYFGPP